MDDKEQWEHVKAVGKMLEDPRIGPAIRELAAPARWYRYFNQSEQWVPNGKPPMLIADMDLAHRLNCTRYLERNAARYANQFAQGCSAEWFALGFSHPGAPDEIEDAIMRQGEHARRDPVGWIKTTKLHRALAADLPSKGAPLRKLAKKARHWGSCGQRLSKHAPCTCAELADQDRRARLAEMQSLAELMVPE